MTAAPADNADFRTRIVETTIKLPSARLGAANPLPKFRWQQPMEKKPVPPHRGLSEDESRNGFIFGDDSILPYLVNDDYDHNPVPQSVPVILIDNGLLGLTVAPQYGGRLLRMHDHARGRDLVFANPVFQPGNLGVLNAWFSGGIEWNGLIPGHTPVSCAQVFTATLDTDRGPILRLYEFDRVLEATWQIDLFLPKGDDRLFVHGRIVNSDPADKFGYWWTNVAVGLEPGMRVVSPAEYGIEHVLPGNQLERFPFPDPARFDGSYPDNWHDATSVFFRAPGAKRLWIAALGQDGIGLAQTATDTMRGRKFFYFGTAAGGQHWMDHLARPGEGKYIEIQAGLATTQNQRFAVAGNSDIHWTEVYGALSVDPEDAHAKDYRRAENAAGLAIETRFPAVELAEIDAFLRQMSVRPTDRRLTIGSPWGARDEQLAGRQLATGLDFSCDEARSDAWGELAFSGKFSQKILASVPADFVVTDRWCEALTRSAEAHGTTWLHELALGIASLDSGNADAAEVLFERSLAKKQTWLGHRQRALVAATPDLALAAYLQAWAEANAPADLADEIVDWLQKVDRYGALADFLASLPKPVLGRERVIFSRARIAARTGKVEELESLLSTEFATIREGESLSEDLWKSLQRNRFIREVGREPSTDEMKRKLATDPLPKRLDFRMSN